MEPWGIAVLVMAAMVIGAVLPLIFQARATLRSLQRVLDDAGPKVSRTLDDVRVAAQQVSLVAKAAGDGTPQLTGLFEAVGGLTTTINQIRGSLKMASLVGAAVGPAIAAAVNSFRNARAPEARPDESGVTDE